MSTLSNPKTLAATVALALAASSASAQMTTIYDGAFVRVPADATVGAAPGRSVAAHCQIDGVTSAEDWMDATAHLTLRQDATSSTVSVRLENGRPETLYTIWLMLAGKTANGESFGGNPLMKGGATALVPTTHLAEAVELINAPSNEALNGFTTDAFGNGQVHLTLDFPVVGGAYPFQRYVEFEATNAVFNRDDARAVPVAITGESAGAPFTLRLASHCGDNLHNGLVPGQHEAWFNWLAE